MALFLTALMVLMTLSPLGQASEGRSTACTSDVCINELMPNPAGSDTGLYPSGEWVELHNSGTSDVNLQGWTLVDAGGWTHNINSTTWVDFGSLATPYTLAAGDYAIIAENEQGSLKINNAGEVLDLKDASGNTIHTVTTGSATSDVSKIPGATPTDDFVNSNTNTPGSANSGGGTGPTTTYTQSEMRITEVMPDTFWTTDNATWPGGEWVEIANVGQIAIDLAGWSVEDAAGNSMQMNTTHLVGQGTIINPGEHRIVAVNGTRTYGMLNNGAGSELVKLLMPNGDITHQVEYAGPTHPGHSYVNSTDMMPDWGRNAEPLVTAKWPTPGTLNPSAITQTVGSIQINEVLANGSQAMPAPDGEWIEIHYPVDENLAQMPIDLSTYSLHSGTGLSIPFDCATDPRCEFGTPSVIEAGEFLIFEIGVNITGELLDNYDSLSLVDGNGDVRQVVNWNTPQSANVSIIPSDPLMVSAPWLDSPYNTPGAANPGQMTGGVDEDAELRISEFMPDPMGADSQPAPNGEWIEIVNVGNDTVDLDGWELRTGTGYTLPSFMLSSGEYHVIHLDTVSMAFSPNNPGTLTLSNPDGEVVHTVTWDHSGHGMSMVSGQTNTDSWVMSPWPTPGAANPLFEQPYSGPTEILMTEVSAQCSSPENGLTSEWIEFLNVGGYQVNLSRWSVRDDAGDEVAVAPGRIWGKSSGSMLVQPGEYAVLNVEVNILSNSNERITLFDPNRVQVQVLEWSSSSDCGTLESAEGGSVTRPTLWPTPGEENPLIEPYDGALTLKFTRFMPKEISNRDNEWFEITNTGDTWVDLQGWKITRNQAAGNPVNSTFGELVIHPGDSAVLTPSPATLAFDSGPSGLDSDVIFGGNPPQLVNSGGALQLVAPDGSLFWLFSLAQNSTWVRIIVPLFYLFSL